MADQVFPNVGALSDLRVIDLSRVLGGPYCTQILADHGADVVKVEPPTGDETRDWGPPFHDEDAAYFIGTNRNKRSIALNLATDAGRVVLMRMLEHADVMIENFLFSSTNGNPPWLEEQLNPRSNRAPKLDQITVTLDRTSFDNSLRLH